jgi:hypothetical protein
MRKFLTICAILLSLSASAQWQQTGSRVRYVNGIGIPTKDTAAGVSADSSQILIRPADSSLYVKYKRTWMRVGGGGGSIAGTGTTNYVSKFTSSTAIGNSQIFDNGTNVGIGTTSPGARLQVGGNTSATQLRIFGGTSGTSSPELQLYGASSDNNWTLRGNHNTDFSIGQGTFGNYGTQLFTLTAGGNVGIGTTSPSARLNIEASGAVTLIKQTAASLSNGVYALDIDNLSHSSNMTAAGAFRIQTNSNSNSFIVNGLGNVGIGTTSPQSRLHTGGSTTSEVSIGNVTFGGNAGQALGSIQSDQTANGGVLYFKTNPWNNSSGVGLYTPQTRMTINDFGNVGIGTTSPAVKLDVNGSISLASGNNLSWGGIYGANIPTIAGLSGSGAYLAFYPSGSTSGETMRITSTGNVGIDYTAPAAKLAVNGTALINTNTDNGVDRLQVSGSMSVSARATVQNLSVTTNATVGGTVTGGSFIPTSSTAPANGMYLQAANSVSLIANSVERIRMPSGLSIIIDPTSAGDLLVGKTTDDGTDKLQVAGSIQGTGFNQAYLARTTTYTAATNDYFIDCTSGTFTVNLFTAVGNTGRILIIKNSGTGTITVDPNGSQTIDGATTQSLSTQWSRVHIISDGANWKIISN